MLQFTLAADHVGGCVWLKTHKMGFFHAKSGGRPQKNPIFWGAPPKNAPLRPTIK